MNDSPFVGRESELETLTNTVTGEDPESLIPVVGTTGIGKSTLLTEFVDRCRDRDHRVLHYNLKEPTSVEQFLSRLLDHWQDVHPSVVSGSRQSMLRKLVGSVGNSLTQTSEPGTSVIGGILNAFVRGDNNAEVTDVTSELLELATKTREKSSTDRFVLVIDQFDEARIDQGVYDEIATLLREIAIDAPQGIVCCIGTRERFYQISNSDVSELELQPFDVEDVRTYLDALELDSTYADRVHDAASGSPYFVERIGQIAADVGSVSTVLDDLSEVETERLRMLEERFLDTLDEFSRRLLRETCFLPELQSQTVATALDADLTTVEDTLHSLERRSILTQLGYSKGNPVYRLHDLHRDFLRERLSDDDRASQHAQAAGYYAIKLAQTRDGSLQELITEEGIQRRREHMTAGIMFEYHLQKFPSQMDAEERVERIFNSVPDQEPTPKEAALAYFKDYREYSVAAETLGVTPSVDAESILTALDNDPYPTRGSEERLKAVIRGLQARDTLNDDQTEVVVLVATAAAYVGQVDITGSDTDREEIVEMLNDRRERLNSEKLPGLHLIYVGSGVWHSILL
jgi:Archaeal ATPase.